MMCCSRGRRERIGRAAKVKAAEAKAAAAQQDDDEDGEDGEDDEPAPKKRKPAAKKAKKVYESTYLCLRADPCALNRFFSAPAVPDGSTTRLVSDSVSGGKFWEITVNGTTVTTRFGKV